MARFLKSGLLTRRLMAVTLCALLLPMTEPVQGVLGGAVDQGSVSPHTYPATSWAMGVVVPEGAAMQGGTKLEWEGVTNVTAVLTLPNISRPDKIVYAVLSVMTGDGTVLQAAAGIRPNDSSWRTYSWFILGVESGRPSYSWIVNASGPQMAPGEDIRISVFRQPSGWRLGVVDEGSGASVDLAFPPGPSASLRAGDQEVFSLESYSRAGATFRDMGNLTLDGLLLNGARVIGGTYPYGDWDPHHHPLFVVGSSGSSPPYFISFSEGGEGSFAWGYSTEWRSTGNSPVLVAAFFSALLIGILAVVGLVLWMTRETRRSQSPLRPPCG